MSVNEPSISFDADMIMLLLQLLLFSCGILHPQVKRMEQSHRNAGQLSAFGGASQLARRIIKWRYSGRCDLGCTPSPYLLTQAEYDAAFAPFQALIEEVVLYDVCEGFSLEESRRFRAEVDIAAGHYIPFVVPWMRRVATELLGSFAIVYIENPLFEERAVLSVFL
jgi:hypothetical protein